ncbi:MAG: hypothetical protein AB8F94_05320 [Saprospiraceae bacterium]
MNAKYLFSLIGILIILTSCSNQKESDPTIKSQAKITNLNLGNQKEIICLVANSEINEYIHATKKKKEFNNTEYLKTLISLNEQLKDDCNFNEAAEKFKTYINSDLFIAEAMKLTLSNNFQAKKIELIRTAKNEEEALEEIVRTMAEITYHQENDKMKMYSRSAIQRLNDFNKNTLELRRNVSYHFPTHFLINEKLLSPPKMNYAGVVISGGSEVGSTKEKQIAASYSNNVIAASTKLTIYVKTIE